MFAFWKKRNRRQVRNSGPTLLERLNWRAIGGAVAAVAGAAVFALLLVVALDRPVRRIVLEGDFQRVSPPEIESTIAGTVRGPLRSNSLSAVLAAARAGHGLAAMPWYVAREAVADGSLRPVLENFALPVQELHAVYPSPKLVPSKVAAFIAFLQEALGERWWEREIA